MLIAAGFGSGILVLPYAMRNVGWGLMFLLLACAGAMSAATTTILMMATARLVGTRRSNIDDALKEPMLLDVDSCEDLRSPPERITYGDVLMVSTGRLWTKSFVDVVVVTGAFGAVVTNFIFMANFLGELPLWNIGDLHTRILLALVACPFMISENISNWSSLAGLSMISMAAMAIVILCEAPRYAETRTAPLHVTANPMRIPATLCICVFSLNWHSNIVPVARELKDPTPLRCLGVGVSASALMTVGYGAVALGGYISFGEATSADIVAMYPENSWLLVLVRLALSAALFVASVVKLFVVRENLFVLAQSFAPHLQASCIAWTALGIFVTAAALAVSIVTPQVVNVMQVAGGTLVSAMVIVFPTIIARTVLSRRGFVLLAILAVPLTLFLMLSALGCFT